MKEGIWSGALSPNSSYRVSTRITAGPLEAQHPWLLSLEKGYGRLGWRSLSSLMILSIVLGTVVVVPLVVTRLGSGPVSSPIYISQEDKRTSL